jgi:hypothetical protein
MKPRSTRIVLYMKLLCKNVGFVFQKKGLSWQEPPPPPPTSKQIWLKPLPHPLPPLPPLTLRMLINANIQWNFFSSSYTQENQHRRLILEMYGLG